MLSLRKSAGCIGVSGTFSVLGDFFGYTGVPKHTQVPLQHDPEKDVTLAEISLLAQMRRLQSPHIGLNLIRVGVEDFTKADELEIDGAVQFARDTYATVDFGIGRVRRYYIPAGDANGHEHIGSEAEATALTNEWTVHNKSIDVFFVLTYKGDPLGSSPYPGPCNKDDDRKSQGTGCVVALEADSPTTGICLAHELGHYLGLDDLYDEDDKSNLMFWTSNYGRLTSQQRQRIGNHCLVVPPCSG